jgi:O-antigen ligase
MKAVRAILVVVALITLYNLYRYVVGPSHQEESLARNALPGVAHHVKLRFFGNFPTAQGLTTWFAIVIPFALALTLAWRGRWQLVAGFVVGVGAFIVIAASVLTATFAMIGGVALVVLLYALSPAFPGGQRLAASVLVLFAVVAVGGTAYALAVSGSSRESKFSAILDPTSDPTFQKRLDRWNQALADIDTHPFGRGLGTTGAAAIGQSTFEPVVTNQLDSSYIEIAFQQGLFVLVLFIMALVALLSGTVQRTIRSRDPARVAVAIGACGVLVAIAAEFFGGLYIERLHMVAAWLLIGLGVAMFTGRRVDDALAEQRAPAREPA